MEILYIEFFGKLNPQSNGYSCILFCWDSFSRFIWLLPIKDMIATMDISSLSSNSFAHSRLPCWIKSDNCTSCTNKLFKEVCNKLHIHTETIPRFNWSNMTERFYLELERFLRAMLKGKAKNTCSKQLPWICLAAYSTIHATTQLLPFFLMYGRQPNLLLEIAHWWLHRENRDDSIPFPQTTAEHAAKIFRKMVEAFSTVKGAWKIVIDHRSATGFWRNFAASESGTLRGDYGGEGWGWFGSQSPGLDDKNDSRYWFTHWPRLVSWCLGLVIF